MWSQSPMRMPSSVCHSDVYESDHGELAQTSATIVAASSRPADPASVTRYARTGAATCPSRIRRFGRVCSPAPSAASIVLSELALTGPPTVADHGRVAAGRS